MKSRNTLAKLAAFVGLSAFAVSSAKTQIVYINPPDLTINPISNPKIYWDFGTGGGSGSSSLSSFCATDLQIKFLFSVPTMYGAAPQLHCFPVSGQFAMNSGYIAKIALGAMIDGSLSFTSGTNNLINSYGSNDANSSAGTTGYIGFLYNSGYAWAQVRYNADQSLTLYDFAYESSGRASRLAPSPSPRPTQRSAAWSRSVSPPTSGGERIGHLGFLKP